MKLFKDEPMYLSKKQWTKLFVAFSIMILVLYTIAMICSLCGSKYFILNYQNEQMDRIEHWLRERNGIGILSWLFSTIEFAIIISFVIKQLPKLYYLLSFYLPIVVLSFFFKIPQFIYYIYNFVFYAIIPVIELSRKNKLNFKNYWINIINLLIALLCVFILQIMIYVIKNGSFTLQSVNLPLSANFCYALEYDIALSVILFTLVLLFDKEKGDSKIWITLHGVCSSSQTSKTQLQKSLLKMNLTKTQKRKIRFLYVKLYVTQLGAFLLIMTLPFLLGKVFEFLVMYLAFAIARYILGFKYSLHYKKESACITAGVIVFGILSLAVPFFYVVLIIAIALGIGLAILLHLSYKYKGFYLFTKIAKPDKFALLYVYFDGDITDHNILKYCKLKQLDEYQTKLILDYMSGMTLPKIAEERNYTMQSIINKLNEAIDELIN